MQKMNIQRVLVALMYAVGVVSATLQASGMPQTSEAWVGIVMAFMIAFWGKFSSSQTIISMNRPAWTDEERAKESLDRLNKDL